MEIRSYTGQQVKDHIPEIARMRIEILREYPFLYEGDVEYEKRYLNKFASMKDAITILVFDNGSLVGAATGFPFIYDAENLQQALHSAGFDPKEFYCFGESILKREYRGQGIGSKFVELREAYAKELGVYTGLCFYTSARPDNDPKRPENYRSLSPFWRKNGFTKHPEIIGTIPYKELGEPEETPKEMVFWIKSLLS